MRCRVLKVSVVAMALAWMGGCGDDDEGTETEATFPDGALTLQQVIDSVAEGGTLTIRAGTHAVNEPVLVTASKSAMRIVAESPGARGESASTLVFSINDQNQDAITILADDVTIQGLRLEGAYRHGVVFDGDDGTLENCYLEGALSYAVHCPDAFSDPTIRGNIIVDAGVFGVLCQAGASPIIENNTIVGSGDCGIRSDVSAPSVRNNLIIDSSVFGIACFGTTLPDIDCNVFWNNGTSGDTHYSPMCSPGALDRIADPLLCDRVDFGVRDDSPCLAANNGACGDVGAALEACQVP